MSALVKIRRPAGRMEEDRNTFKEEQGYNPEPYSWEAHEEVSEADMPHHPTKKGQANNELGDPHAMVSTLWRLAG